MQVSEVVRAQALIAWICTLVFPKPALCVLRFQDAPQNLGAWTLLDSITGTYLEGAGGTILPDGRTFWGYSVPNSLTLKATM